MPGISYIPFQAKTAGDYLQQGLAAGGAGIAQGMYQKKENEFKQQQLDMQKEQVASQLADNKARRELAETEGYDKSLIIGTQLFEKFGGKWPPGMAGKFDEMNKLPPGTIEGITKHLGTPGGGILADMEARLIKEGKPIGLSAFNDLEKGLPSSLTAVQRKSFKESYDQKRKWHQEQVDAEYKKTAEAQKMQKFKAETKQGEMNTRRTEIMLELAETIAKFGLDAKEGKAAAAELSAMQGGGVNVNIQQTPQEKIISKRNEKLYESTKKILTTSRNTQSEELNSFDTAEAKIDKSNLTQSLAQFDEDVDLIRDAIILGREEADPELKDYWTKKLNAIESLRFMAKQPFEGSK